MILNRSCVRRLGWILFALLLAACKPPVPLPSPPAPPATSPTPLHTFPSPLTATPSPLPPTVTPSPAPLNLSNPRTQVLVSGLPNPDDLALAPDGSIIISTIGDGSVRRYTPMGDLETVLTGLSVPEGMLFLPDGALLIAEQGRNRLVRYDPTAKTAVTFLELANHSGQDGVDGIALDSRDPARLSLIVPDSPNGRVLRISLDGKEVSVLARGLVRPTGAWVEPDGAILLADEFGNALMRLHPDGALEKLADLPQPDDVVEDGAGNIFACTLVDGAVYVIPAGSNTAHVLAAGFHQPQGLIMTADGNLVVTDSGRGRLVKVLIHP